MIFESRISGAQPIVSSASGAMSDGQCLTEAPAPGQCLTGWAMSDGGQSADRTTDHLASLLCYPLVVYPPLFFPDLEQGGKTVTVSKRCAAGEFFCNLVIGFRVLH